MRGAHLDRAEDLHEGDREPAVGLSDGFLGGFEGGDVFDNVSERGGRRAAFEETGHALNKTVVNVGEVDSERVDAFGAVERGAEGVGGVRSLEPELGDDAGVELEGQQVARGGSGAADGGHFWVPAPAGKQGVDHFQRVDPIMEKARIGVEKLARPKGVDGSDLTDFLMRDSGDLGGEAQRRSRVTRRLVSRGGIKNGPCVRQGEGEGLVHVGGEPALQGWKGQGAVVASSHRQDQHAVRVSQQRVKAWLFADTKAERGFPPPGDVRLGESVVAWVEKRSDLAARLPGREQGVDPLRKFGQMRRIDAKHAEANERHKGAICYRRLMFSVTATFGGCVAFLLSLAMPALAQTRPATEIRGTWLTTTGNDALASPEKTAETMRRLRDIGLNTVYVECWKNGYTEFPSATMKTAIGVEMKINGGGPDRDLLREAVREGHANGLTVIAWLEYGFMAAWKDTPNELRALGEKEGFLLRSKKGEFVGKQNGFVWMNPLHPKAQLLLLGIAREAATSGADGVQLDDRIAFPVEMGYDAFTKDLYAREHAGQAPPADVADKDWIAWRAAKVSAFSARFVAEMRKANPRLRLSVSPAPYPWSLEHYCCEWPKWTEWDEWVPQFYRLNFDATKQAIADDLPLVGARRQDLVAGIRIIGDGLPMPWEDLRKSIEYTRRAGLGGHVLWYSKGVLELYSEQLKAFYSGRLPAEKNR